MKLDIAKTYNLGLKPKQVRTCEVNLGYEMGRFFAYSESENVDPCQANVYPWQKPMHIAMYGAKGQQLWHRELGLGLAPGIWFMPFIAFDLDEDGIDEIWFINNTSKHPFEPTSMVLERVNSINGNTIAQYPFNAQNIAYDYFITEAYRYIIFAGYVKGEPVIVTQQGIYENMYIQCYNRDMSLRWDKVIGLKEGPRASHSWPVFDINDDGIDEVLVGERAISLNDGSEVMCGDRDSFFGHSDVVTPFTDYRTGKKLIFTCRESGNYVGCPRLVMFDYNGEKVWEKVYIDPDPNIFCHGHIHRGYVVTMEPDLKRVAIGVNVDGSVYAYEAVSGEPVELPIALTLRHRPLDIDGDGYHEYIREDGCELYDSSGKLLYRAGGNLIQVGKVENLPGEQFISFYENEGVVRIWQDLDAKDSEALLIRYKGDFHKRMNKMMGNSYNFMCSIDCAG